MYAMGSTLYLADLLYLHHEGDTCPRREVMEQLLYVIGSFVFMVGCLIWDPSFIETFVAEFGREKHWWYCFADLTFLIGSLMFAVAAFLSALSIKHVHPEVEKFALGVLACYEFGGLLFVAGTMGFMGPGFYGCGHDMQILGTIFYIVGSALYVMGSVLSFMKTLVHHQLVRECHLQRVKKDCWPSEAAQLDYDVELPRVAVEDTLGLMWERLNQRKEEHDQATRRLGESLAACARTASLSGGTTSSRQLLDELARELQGNAQQEAKALEEDVRLIQQAINAGVAPHKRPVHDTLRVDQAHTISQAEHTREDFGLRASSLLRTVSQASTCSSLTSVLSSSFVEVLQRSWSRLLILDSNGGYLCSLESDTESTSDGSP
eukprot:CAMPEP_0115207742 /NCGR_PEP_ID=MMETSP0270-20121206/20870_1 /TAXON_ID=71861 /ORGANISM="Scrippsiella trochoidea, Strain CCMP3099" /LENGTH=376 /DNA_ID=CAMNT_0002621339 /DNA_START=282 /DNA_END=1412 /DNA_ORIENTATION=+